MGGTVSFVAGNPTPNDVKTILNVIMRQMFLRADLIDLYSLADPDRCSKYVVVAANALNKLFISINLEPKKGPDGTIFFQKISGIQKANPMGGEQDKLCKYLAFYFIRIFQIYAALTLSIMDSELPASDPVAPKTGAPKSTQGVVVLGPPDLQGFQQPQRRGFGWVGGALSSAPFVPPAGQPAGSGNYYLDPQRASLYKILNYFLLMPADNPPASEAEMRFQDSDLTIAQDDLYTFDPNPANRAASRLVKDFSIAATARPVVMYNFKDTKNKWRIISGRLLLTRDRDNNMDVTLENVKFTDKPATKTVTDKLNNRRPGDENPVSRSGKQLPGLIQELFIKAGDEIEPSTFSVIEFLKKYKLINAMNGTVRIEGTRISISNPGAHVAKRYVPIAYNDRTKVQDRSTDIRIFTELFITKQPNTVASESQAYTIGIDMNGLQTEPSGFKDSLDLSRKERRRDFFSDDYTTVPLSDRGETIAAFLQSVFEDLLKGKAAERVVGGIAYNTLGHPKPYDSKDIPEEFKVQRLWKALSKDPPIKAHCVARAVQLLNVSAIRDPSTGEPYSSVCHVKFPYIVDGSLPTPGQTIMTDEGVYSMAMLFVDQLVGPNTMPRVTATPEFSAFRQRLKFNFERLPDLAATPVPDTLGSVTEKQSHLCDGHTDDKLILRNPTLTQELRAKANELMNRQRVHIGRVMTIMFKLFDERQVRSGALAINGQILTGGMEAINRLAEEARRVLIDYYSDCEKTYKEGLFAIANREASRPGSIEPQEVR